MKGLYSRLFALILLTFVRRGAAQESCFGPRIPGLTLVPLSGAKKCFQSVKLDPETTIQGINSWFETLKALYTFYNVARDARDSSPIGTQVHGVFELVTVKARRARDRVDWYVVTVTFRVNLLCSMRLCMGRRKSVPVACLQRAIWWSDRL